MVTIKLNNPLIKLMFILLVLMTIVLIFVSYFSCKTILDLKVSTKELELERLQMINYLFERDLNNDIYLDQNTIDFLNEFWDWSLCIIWKN